MLHYALKKNVYKYTANFLKIGFYKIKVPVIQYLLTTAYSERPVLGTIRCKTYNK